jgi:hypothetical protein
MTHDPLCFEFDSKDDDCFDHSLNSPFCYCELIAKVRADEREACIEDIASFYASGANTEYWRGFDKGLTKAISLLHMGRNESF